MAKHSRSELVLVQQLRKTRQGGNSDAIIETTETFCGLVQILDISGVLAGVSGFELLNTLMKSSGV